MLSVADARARILGAFSPLAAEIVSVADALGRGLAEDIAARVTQPPHAVSAMDGYAVRAEDTAALPAMLRVVGEAPAGQAHPHPLGPGEAVRIFTGAPLPDGADAIVIQEDTTREGDTVTVHEAATAGRWIRPAGLDFAAGAVGLRAGRRLTARDVGLAAAMNHPWLPVHRRPRVALLGTGDEVVLPGDPLGAHQIVSSNGFALAAAVTAGGGVPLNLGIAPDNRAALADRIAAARGCDLLVTAGGASVGAHDLVQEVLKDSGARLDFWKIAMRPGKPLMFGHLDATPVLGLPGNPVSAMVCAILFLMPALAVMRGGDGTLPHRRARLAVDLPGNGGREDYIRATLETDSHGGQQVAPLGVQDSSVLSSLAAAEALLIRPPHAPPATAGDSVDILPLDAGPSLV